MRSRVNALACRLARETLVGHAARQPELAAQMQRSAATFDARAFSARRDANLATAARGQKRGAATATAAAAAAEPSPAQVQAARAQVEKEMASEGNATAAILQRDASGGWRGDWEAPLPGLPAAAAAAAAGAGAPLHGPPARAVSPGDADAPFNDDDWYDN